MRYQITNFHQYKRTFLCVKFFPLFSLTVLSIMRQGSLSRDRGSFEVLVFLVPTCLKLFQFHLLPSFRVDIIFFCRYALGPDEVFYLHPNGTLSVDGRIFSPDDFCMDAKVVGDGNVSQVFPLICFEGLPPSNAEYFIRYTIYPIGR